ncbi:MAG: hypothetical protein TUN42_08960 [Dehalogenimonas sp.]
MEPAAFALIVGLVGTGVLFLLKSVLGTIVKPTTWLAGVGGMLLGIGFLAFQKSLSVDDLWVWVGFEYTCAAVGIEGIIIMIADRSKWTNNQTAAWSGISVLAFALFLLVLILRS